MFKLVPRPLQILPTEQGENVPFVFGWLTGLMMYAPLAIKGRQYSRLPWQDECRLQLQVC